MFKRLSIIGIMVLLAVMFHSTGSQANPLLVRTCDTNWNCQWSPYPASNLNGSTRNMGQVQYVGQQQIFRMELLHLSADGNASCPEATPNEGSFTSINSPQGTLQNIFDIPSNAIGLWSESGVVIEGAWWWYTCTGVAGTPPGVYTQQVTINPTTAPELFSGCGGPYSHTPVTFTLSCEILPLITPTPTPTPSITPTPIPTATPTPSPTPVATPTPYPWTGEPHIRTNVFLVLDRSGSMNAMSNNCGLGPTGAALAPPIATGPDVPGPFTTNPCGTAYPDAFNPSTGTSCVYDPDHSKIAEARRALTGDAGVLEYVQWPWWPSACNPYAQRAYNPGNHTGLLDLRADDANWALMLFSSSQYFVTLGFPVPPETMQYRLFDMYPWDNWPLYQGLNNNDRPRGETYSSDVFQSLTDYFEFENYILIDPFDPTQTQPNTKNMLIRPPATNVYPEGACQDNAVIYISDGKHTPGHNPLASDPTSEVNTLNNNPVRDLFRVGERIKADGNAPDWSNAGAPAPGFGTVKIFSVAYALAGDPQAFDEMVKIGDLGDNGEADGSATTHPAATAEELSSVVSNILNSLNTGTYTRARPRLSGSSTVPGATRNIVSAYYEVIDGKHQFEGHVKAFAVDNTGTLTPNPNTADGSLWDAANRVTADDMNVPPNPPTVHRNVRVAGSSGGASFDPFTRSNASLTAAALGLTDASLPVELRDVDGNGTPAQTEDKDALIDFVRWGSNITHFAGSNELRSSAANTKRLGAFFHSSPTVVGQPDRDSYFQLPLYSNFVVQWATRPTKIYIGGLDAMLHQLNGTPQPAPTPGGGTVPGGEETWAGIFNRMLGLLPKQRDPNVGSFTPGLDGSAGFSDAFINVNGAYGWRTELVIGCRTGCKGYFATDVSNPSDPLYLWQFTDLDDTDLSNSYANPTVFRIDPGTWEATGDPAGFVVGFSGGPGSPYHYILDASNGTIVRKFGEDTGSPLGIHARLSDPNPDQAGGAAPPVPNRVGVTEHGFVGEASYVDWDNDSKVDFGYIADKAGFVWKIVFDAQDPAQYDYCLFADPADFNHNGTADWLDSPNPVDPQSTLHPVATSYANARRPVTLKMAVTRMGDDSAVIAVGQGDEDAPPASSQNRLFLLRDPSPVGACQRGELIPSDSNPYLMADPANANFPNTGEFLAADPVISNGLVFFVSFAPGDTCSKGKSYLNVIDLNGVPVDMDHDPGNGSFVNHVEIGDGMASGLIIINGNVYVTTTVDPNPFIPPFGGGWPTSGTGVRMGGVFFPGLGP